ncbi:MULTISPECIES: class I SAM-dependent methyltransferase [unclassified Dysgonomonas]|uniref:class I SAM-dependent methyltransferase n=1 Tax=unclassified Dysgonomonas TaxID=2630389 RepID=UPI0013EB07FB|nr:MULTISPECIES: class I SAM-dependent methyltransferase [unclassified Dysgonomonas]
MPRIYRLSRTGLKLLYKIRHHRGHGIHSPFVFNLINKVIEEKTPYHAYEDIQAYLDSVPNIDYSQRKYNLLSFRLVNYFEAKQILEIGSGTGVNTIYLTAPSSKIDCNCAELSVKKIARAQRIYKEWGRKINLNTHGLPVLDKKQDCIFIDLNNYNKLNSNLVNYILPLIHEGTFIIVKDIRTNKRHQMLWKSIMDMESRTAVLDLFNIGIVFFDRKLYRWNYQISF